MDTPFDCAHYRLITISGKIAVGTTTLAKNLSHFLHWQHVNAGEIQRRYDREHGINENKQGALARPDEHERSIEEMAKKLLKNDTHTVYEAWLAGFLAKDLKDVLRIFVICSHEDLRIDRVVNRENISVEEAKHWLKQREEENTAKWKALYGDYDFWDPQYYDLVIDTYSTGPMQTLGRVLDKLGYRVKHQK